MSELCDRPAVELADLIAAKKLSPVELWEASLARIAAVNPAVNAIVTLDAEAGRRAAKTAEAAIMKGESPGRLAGLPVAIKDLSATRRLRTTWGSELYRDHVPDRDDLIVARIRAAGAIIAAKTNTSEFGSGANTWNRVFGVTGNPFDPALTPAGSSGGSAVAVATSMLALATGSDLGGSLRTPAGYCGVVGMRPSPGLVADANGTRGFSPLDVKGPLARSVADLHLLLGAMAGTDMGDPFSRPTDCGPGVGPLVPADLGTLRVAFSEDLAFAPVSRKVRGLFGERMKALDGLFATLEERDPPLRDAETIFQVLRGVGYLAEHLDRLRQSPEKVGPNVTANVKLGLGLSAEEIARAEAAHTALYRRFLAFMEGCDLLLAPVASVQPFDKRLNAPEEIDGERLRNYVSWIAITFGITLTAHPVVVLPCGRDARGLPFGLQLVGRRGEDNRLLGIAAALEAALAGNEATARPVPDLARLEGL